jgi:hypothetical protein
MLWLVALLGSFMGRGCGSGSGSDVGVVVEANEKGLGVEKQELSRTFNVP